MRARYFLIPAIVLSALAAGCATQNQNVFLSDQRKLGKEFSTFVPPKNFSGDHAIPAFPPPTGALTLQQALAAGLMHNPGLAAFSWDVRAAEARELQAGLPPNPELSTEVENFGGTREQKNFKSAETTVQISQLVELGGKRSKRKQLAGIEKNLAGWDYETKRLDVFTDVTKAFWDVFAAQERLTIAGELARLAEQAYTCVVERVNAGKVPPVEEIQARVSMATAKIESAQARRELETCRKKLAAAWGSTTASFEKASGVIDTIAAIPPQEQLEPLISQNPDVARWAAEVEKARAAVKLKDAGAIPDVTIGAGPRYFNETDNKAFVMAMTVPIPVFNRNQGERQEARCGLAKAEQEQKAALVKTQTELAAAYQELSSAVMTAASLKDAALPAADSAFNASLEGYRAGKFSYLMVLDSQRTLFEAKRQYTESLAEYHKARASIERLIAQSLPQ